ncbi:glycosyltransferase family 4 protein [Kaistia granuli]|uniref:glycosyltransferase family 4 protein n=1 Tax=Kaistia granuli TaxID=363259 RepID=UPI00039C1A17|nr:glycosyltransferase family 4 protein [Kaistia granuli]
MVLPSLGAGGSEGVVSFLANIWVERGWPITIVTLESQATPPYYPLDARIQLVRLNLPVGRYRPLRALWRAVQRVRRLRGEFKRQSPDLIISFLTRTNILTLLAADGLDVRVVISERNNPELQTIGRTWSWLRRVLYPRAFGLVTMTKGAMELFPQDQRSIGWVIPNQVNLPSDLQPRRGNKIVAAVGRLVEQKGFDLLLEAFARVAPAHPDWTLVIWGEGPERGRLTAQRDALGLTDRVQLPGVTKRPGLWIETADVFVLSSRYEGWGIVLMEAMAAGLPVISFNCRFGPDEMITHEQDGLLVPDGDVGALAAGLSRLLADEPLRRHLGATAASSALRFSSRRVMVGWDDVVHTALTSRDRPG